MKHIHTFENFLNEANVFNNFSAQEKKAWKNVQKLNESYSSSDIKKLEEFAEELSDEIRDYAHIPPLNYRDYEDFSPENFFEYITGEGYGTSRSKFGEDKNLKTAADVIKKYNSIIRPLTVKKLKKEMGL